MHFSRRDQFFQASRITGPRHNFLTISFGAQHDVAAPPTIETLPPRGTCRHDALDPPRILLAVVDGVNAANTQFGAQFAVQHVQYVENDTGPEQTYGASSRSRSSSLSSVVARSNLYVPHRIK